MYTKPGRTGDASTQAHEQLRELILSGRLLPGQRLTQRELMEELGVGRTPLREALRMLEAEGFVTAKANHGVTVAGIDLNEAEELYAALLLLQPPLLVRGAESVTDEALEKMGSLSHGMRERPREPRDFHQDHVDFHMLPKEGFGPVLRRTILDLYERLYRLQRFYYNRRQLPGYILDLDAAFLEALRARDGRRARRLQELHMLSSAIGLILDADPWHKFGPLVDAAAGLGITVETAEDGTLTAPVRLVWAEPLPGYTPVPTMFAVDATSYPDPPAAT
ncbi:hypothetical protein GCM10023205_68150 [Yinghuangia aomiensis]|uniref:HTH gntR-type domain-containing protein n=1 Tax=Yinghuangia aomiensis TaxID=676205 RepID=A0ABP9I588_9ACTN